MNDDVARCPHGADSSVFCDICDENYREELAGSPGGPGPAAAGEAASKGQIERALLDAFGFTTISDLEWAHYKRFADALAALRSSAPAPEAAAGERIVRHPNGHLMVERVPPYIPSEDAEARALASLAKAYPYLVKHAEHIDGEFDNALSDVRRMFAAFRAALRSSAPAPEPSDAAAEAFLEAHHADAPFSNSGIQAYPHGERVDYIKKWLRAAYAVDFGASRGAPEAASAEALREALGNLVDGEPCEIHPSGYCMTHHEKLRGGPCPMEFARRVLRGGLPPTERSGPREPTAAEIAFIEDDIAKSALPPTERSET